MRARFHFYDEHADAAAHRAVFEALMLREGEALEQLADVQRAARRSLP